MSGGSVEEETVVEVCRPDALKGLVGVRGDHEGDSFVDREPVEVSQVIGDVAAAGDVQD